MKACLRISGLMLIILSISKFAMAQQNRHMVRIAHIQVDPLQLTAYNTALKTQMTTAIKEEPGVLAYYAVANKNNPADVTIFETYADTAAYQAHIQTAHFKKYKATVEHMVKHLELVDVNVIGIARKPGY